MKSQSYRLASNAPSFQPSTRAQHAAAITQALIGDQNRTLAESVEMHTSAGELGRLLGIEPGGQRGVSGLLRKLSENGLVLRRANQSRRTPAALCWQAFGSFLGIAIAPEQKKVYAALTNICGNVHQVPSGAGTGSRFLYEKSCEPAFAEMFDNFERRRLNLYSGVAGIELGAARDKFRQAVKREYYLALKWALSALGDCDWDNAPVVDFAPGLRPGFQIAAKNRASAGQADFRSALMGVGISVEGLVDSDSGTVRRSLNYDIGQDFHLKDELIEYLRLNNLVFDGPIAVENEVNSLGRLAQLEGLALEGLTFRFAEFDEKDNVLILKLRDGLGGAILSGRDLLLGQHRFAGEVGHLAVEYNDRPGPGPAALGARLCRCGREGCGESIVQDRPLLEDFIARYADASAPPLEPLPEIDRSIGGDIPAWLLSMEQSESEPVKAAAAGTLGRAGRALGRTVAYIYSLLDPAEIVVFSSSLYRSEVFCGAVAEHSNGNRYPMLNNPSIRYVDFNDRYVAQGAACAAIQDYLSSDAAPWANW